MHSSDVNVSVNKLVILDFRKNITFIYTLPYEYCNDTVEVFICNNGHSLNCCQWMLTKNEVIIK